MPKNEEGEFELILGNRQLLSVFFIVVILLGVFFTMGYIVGRNSAPAALAAINSNKAAVPAPEPAPPPADAPKAAESAPVETAKQKAADATPEAPAKTESTKVAEPVTPARTETRKEKASKAPPPAVNSDPVAGQTYLQLAATSKHEADIMVDVLRTKGFHSIAAEIPEKAGTFRVLVGPITDGAMNKTRADLQASGFPGNVAIRRAF